MPGSQLTALTPSLSEATTTLSSVPVDDTSQSAREPESSKDYLETREGIPTMKAEIPMDSKEAVGDDIIGDTMEVTSVVADTTADKPVLDTTDEETVPTIEQDDKSVEILHHDLGYSEAIQEVTAKGEEPPSEVVAQEALIKATSAVNATPTTQTAEELGLEVSPEYVPEASLQVEDLMDEFLAVTPKAELSDEILEIPTTDSPELITEIVPDLGEAANLEKPNENQQKPTVEQPSIHQTPGTESVFDVEAEIPSQTSMMFTVEIQDRTPALTEEISLQSTAVEAEQAEELEAIGVSERATLGSKDKATEGAAKEGSSQVGSKSSEVTESSIDAATKEEPTVQREDFTPRKAESERVVPLSTVEEPVESVKPVDEISKESDGGTITATGEPLHVSVEHLEVEMTVKAPAIEMVETSEDVVEPIEAVGTVTAKVDEKTKPTREPAGEQSVMQTERTKEPAQEPDVVQNGLAETTPEQALEHVEQNKPTEDPGYFLEIKPTAENAQKETPEVPADDDKIELSVDETEKRDGGQPPADSNGAQRSEFTEGSKPDIMETFDGGPLESDEEITPVVVTVPENTEGLLPGTEVKATPEIGVKGTDLPLSTSREISTHVVQPTDEVTASTHLPYAEREITPDLPSKTSEDSDTPKAFPASPEDFAPEEDRIPGVDSPTPAEEDDVTTEETMAPPADVSSDLPDFTAESPPGSEQVTSGLSLEVTTKYIVEYNNGNFPDPTVRPYNRDDDLLGNNGFGLEDDKETSVSKQGFIFRVEAHLHLLSLSLLYLPAHADWQ